MIHITEQEFWNFIDQDLSEDETSRITMHLELCSQCQQVYQSQLELQQVLKEVKHDIPSLAFSKNVITRLEKELEIDKNLQFWLQFTKVAIASALGFTMLTMLFILGSQNIELPSIKAELVQVTFILLIAGILAWAFYGLDILCINLSRKQIRRSN